MHISNPILAKSSPLTGFFLNVFLIVDKGNKWLYFYKATKLQPPRINQIKDVHFYDTEILFPHIHSMAMPHKSHKDVPIAN